MNVKDSLLGLMVLNDEGKFSQNCDEDGYIFIDRDGDRFRHVLNYLRGGDVTSFEEAWRFEEIAEEADFLGLIELRDTCAQQIEQLRERRKELDEVARQKPRVVVIDRSGKITPVKSAEGDLSFAGLRVGGLDLGDFRMNEEF